MSTPKLSGGRFQPADFSIGRYAAMVPAQTTLSDVLHPEYFQNHLASLRPGMEVSVLSDDFALDCRLRVLTVTKTTVKFRTLDVHAGERAEPKPAEITEVKVGFGGPNHKWRFVHAGQVIKFGFATEAEAQVAADEYLETLKG